jgi:hypothetical protein
MKKLGQQIYIEQDPDPVFFGGRIRIQSKKVRIRNTASEDYFCLSTIFHSTVRLSCTLILKENDFVCFLLVYLLYI